MIISDSMNFFMEVWCCQVMSTNIYILCLLFKITCYSIEDDHDMQTRTPLYKKTKDEKREGQIYKEEEKRKVVAQVYITTT